MAYPLLAATEYYARGINSVWLSSQNFDITLYTYFLSSTWAMENLLTNFVMLFAMIFNIKILYHLNINCMLYTIFFPVHMSKKFMTKLFAVVCHVYQNIWKRKKKDVYQNIIHQISCIHFLSGTCAEEKLSTRKRVVTLQCTCKMSQVICHITTIHVM